MPAEGGRQAGWGDLVGGAVVVIRRTETGETYVGEVPIGLFQGEAFKCQLYLDRVEELVIEGVEVLKVSNDEPIYICMGYILSKARKAMEERCLNVMTTKIRGETQALAEREFIRSLAGMGIGDEASLAGMRNFNAFLRWVLEDLDNREHFVKTGWPAWSRLKEGRAS